MISRRLRDRRVVQQCACRRCGCRRAELETVGRHVRRRGRTINLAIVGLDVGQVREGYLADLLIVDGDPTSDITLLRDRAKIGMVIKGGDLAYINPAVYP